ncbi:MAG: hypothetical protein WAK12_02200 [Acidimicrobiales bacterium]
MSTASNSAFLHRVAHVIAVALVIGYAWFATGVTPFHTLSYVVVAIPSLIVAGLYVFYGALAGDASGASRYYRQRSLGASLSSSMPWLVVLVGAIALEVVGLALGGRSKSAPTLSTTVDHLLVTHWLRCVLFLAWLAVVALPLRRLHQHRLARGG